MDGNGHEEFVVKSMVDIRESTLHPLIARNVSRAMEALEHTSRVTDEQRREAQERHHRQLEGGYIDPGPPTDHSTSVTDVRDMRDPEDLGTRIMEARRLRGDCTSASAASDMLDRIGTDVKMYQDTPVDHAAFRRAELEARAAEGDRFAQAELRGESLAEDPVD